jgi:hypothetical protein
MSAAAEPSSPSDPPARRPIRDIVLYFLRLSTLGFGGPVALVGATAVIGLITFPLLQPAWVMVK